MLDLDALATKAEPETRAEFVHVWEVMQEQYVSLDLFTKALAERRSFPIQDALPWQGLVNALYVEYKRILLRLFEQGGQAQFEALLRKAEKPTAFSIQHPEAERWARQYAAQLVQGLTTESRRAMAQAIAELIRLQIPPAEGARLLRQMLGLHPRYARAVVNFQNDLRVQGYAPAYIQAKADEYAKRLLNHRAETVARTETLRAVQEGQRQSFQQAVEQGVLRPERTRRQWVTAADERVCFRAGTAVLTEHGERPIERIRVGDRVMTHKGLRRVTATRSAYTSAPMVAVRAGERTTECTFDHPYVCMRDGKTMWLEAGLLRQGDYILQSRPDGLLGSDTFYVGLCDAHDTPTATREKGVLAGVPGFVAVPVRAVHFEGYPVVGQGEVDGVASEAHFLDGHNPDGGERPTGLCFQPRFSLETTPTGERAEPESTSGANPELGGAVGAGDNTRRAAALLGTELPVEFVGVESLSTPPTVRVSSDRKTTLARADREPVGYLLGDRKVLVAAGAPPGDHCGSLEGPIAGVSAEPSPLRGTPERLLAMEAGARVLGPDGGGVVTSIPAELGGSLGPLGECPIAADTLPVSVSHTVIYDLQVEDASTFIANGILVHNCPICAPMDGQLATLDEPWDTPIGPVQTPTDTHPQCRCSVVLVFVQADGTFPTRDPRPGFTGQPRNPPRSLRPRLRAP